MLKIIHELKLVSSQNAAQMPTKDASLRAKDGSQRANHVSFDDLSKTMEEFDLVLRRPPFLEEKPSSSLVQAQGPTAAQGSHS